MNLGRKKYRKPACYLRYLNSSGIYENYQISKHGFKRIDNNFTNIPINQSYLNDPMPNQNDIENDTNIINNLNDFSGNTNYLNNQYTLVDPPNERMNHVNSEGSMLNNYNQPNIINIQPNYIELSQNLPPSQPSLSCEQINYANTGNQNQISNAIIENNDGPNNYLETQQIHQFTQPNIIENQPSSNSNLDDTSLYEKIMSDNINLVLKECHLIKPDEVLVLYKIVPD